MREILDRLTRLETKLDNYNGYREKTDEAFTVAKNNKERLDKIEANIQWLWRLIAGALLLGILAATIQFK